MRRSRDNTGLDVAEAPTGPPARCGHRKDPLSRQVARPAGTGLERARPRDNELRNHDTTRWPNWFSPAELRVMPESRVFSCSAPPLIARVELSYP